MLYTYNLLASFWKEGSASGSGNDNISDVECPGRIIAVDKLKATYIRISYSTTDSVNLFALFIKESCTKINIVQQHLNVLVFKPSAGTVPQLLIQLLTSSNTYCFSWILC